MKSFALAIIAACTMAVEIDLSHLEFDSEKFDFSTFTQVDEEHVPILASQVAVQAGAYPDSGENYVRDLIKAQYDIWDGGYIDIVTREMRLEMFNQFT